LFLIGVIVFGIEVANNDEHPLKQLFPIEVIVFGIEIDDNNEHPLKQLFPIEELYLKLKLMILMNIH
jgi:hypothetical protein